MYLKDNDKNRRTSICTTGTATKQQNAASANSALETTENVCEGNFKGKLVRIILIDEQPLFRTGVRVTLERTGNYVIVGEMVNIPDIFEKIQVDAPDIALIDTKLILADPFDLAQHMHLLVPHLASIMLAQSEDEHDLLASINAGASAYLLRNVSKKKLITTLSAVGRGEYPIQEKVFSNPKLSRVVFQSIENMRTTREEALQDHDSMPLSQRELEILNSIAHGRTNKAVAESLQISDQTVKNHITSILRKLSVTDRTSAVMYALRHDWITLDEQ